MGSKRPKPSPVWGNLHWLIWYHKISWVSFILSQQKGLFAKSYYIHTDNYQPRFTWLSYTETSSARSSSLFIELEFHRVSNCWVRTWVKLNFCLSISSFGSSDMSFAGFFELKFSRVWGLRGKTHQEFEFWVAWSGTRNKMRKNLAFYSKIRFLTPFWNIFD